MQKIVINTAIGGFSLSKEAFEMLLSLNNAGAIEEQQLIETDNYRPDDYYHGSYIKRDDLELVQVIRTLGDTANGRYSKLKVVEIPDNIEWYIFSNEDGTESIHEQHRHWSQ